jgi:hypothetical protein
MVRALADGPSALWLEPSHGTGVFVEAISDLGVPEHQIIAVDLDRRSSSRDNLATTIRGVDFLRWSQETNLRFDRIVGNPPYVSIKRLPVSLRRTAAAILDVSGSPIGESANTWYAFVLASLQLLKKGGALAFVLPSAAEFSKYSAAIRFAVHQSFERLELYRCKRPLFEGVQEGTVVALARGYSLGGECKVSRRRFTSSQELIETLENSALSKGRRCKPRVKRIAAMTPLKSIARIRLGGVTGDASFFLMTEEKRKALRLPTVACTPVLSKARHLKFAPFEKQHWRELRQSGERIWLLNPTSDIIRRSAPVRSYLYLPLEQGGCNRQAYKVRDRKPWYRTPLLTCADAFISGMSQQGPWLCINEMRELRATNTLYVVNFLRHHEHRYMWSLALLTSIAQRQIRGIARHYADGLIKYEPGDLAEVEIPTLKPDVDHRSLYEQAVVALLANDLPTAKEIADSVRL